MPELGPWRVRRRQEEMLSVGSVGDSYDNALAETINGLYKAELIRRRAQLLDEPAPTNPGGSPLKRSQRQADAGHDRIPRALLLLRIHEVKTVNCPAGPRKVATAV